MNSNRSPKLPIHSFRTLTAALAAAATASLLTGCGMSSLGKSVATPVTAHAIHLSGNVHGGQQPVSGATIQLYAVGSANLRSASSPLIGQTITTDANGNFNVTGDYTCPTPAGQQVYLTATGGNPGGGVNTAISLVIALGSCDALTPSTFVVLNEVTTVAAAYALAPFAGDITHVGASGVNAPGLVAAFGNAAVLANPASGMSPGGNLGTGVTVPNAEINTLADIIAACVNTTGSTSSQCSTLFSATSASDTFGATLAIAKNPGASAITSLYTLASPTSPFQPTLSSSSAPKDFTVAVTSTGGGTLATPFGIAIDANGYAYVANESGTTVSQLNNTNPALLNTIAATGLAGPQGLAVDRNANLWIANTAGNSVIKVAVSATTIGTPVSYTTGITGPSAVAIDSANNAFVANFNGNSVVGLTSAGAALAGSPFTGNGNITLPQAVAVGPTGAVYATSGTGAVVKLSNAGAYTASLTDGTLQAPAGVVVDASGHILASGFTTGSAVGGGLSEFNSSGAALSNSPATSGLNTPQGIATDGVSTWVVNSVAGGGLAEFVYGSATPMSPTAGFGSLNVPVGVAVDNAGCVWVTNSGNNTVSKFIGLSTPIATPLAANVGP